MQKTAAQIAAERPEAVRVFQRHGLDFCSCGRKRPLDAACRASGLECEAVLAEVAAQERHAATAADRRWDEAPVPELIAHLASAHHGWFDAELPRIVFLARKAARTHGEAHPELAAIEEIVPELVDAFVSHMRAQERVVFPRLLASPGPDARGAASDDLARRRDALRRLREVTSGYVAPRWACLTVRALWHALEDLEARELEHARLEDEVLFAPHRAIRAPRARAARRC